MNFSEKLQTVSQSGRFPEASTNLFIMLLGASSTDIKPDLR